MDKNNDEAAAATVGQMQQMENGKFYMQKRLTKCRRRCLGAAGGENGRSRGQ